MARLADVSEADCFSQPSTTILDFGPPITRSASVPVNSDQHIWVFCFASARLFFLFIFVISVLVKADF